MSNLSHDRTNHNPPRSTKMNEPSTEVLVYTVPQVARMLGINRNLGYELARQGQIPTIKLGRRLLCPKAAVDRWLGEAGQGLKNGQG